MNVINSVQAVQSVSTLAGTQAAGEAKPAGGAKSFADYLVDALEYVNGKQLDKAAIGRQLVVDPDSVDIHDVTTAVAYATMSLEAANRIINQMISSWNDITTTR
jgi:flagellar hook-basal body complex protein FliE